MSYLLCMCICHICCASVFVPWRRNWEANPLSPAMKKTSFLVVGLWYALVSPLQESVSPFLLISAISFFYCLTIFPPLSWSVRSSLSATTVAVSVSADQFALLFLLFSHLFPFSACQFSLLFLLILSFPLSEIWSSFSLSCLSVCSPLSADVIFPPFCLSILAFLFLLWQYFVPY